MAVAEPTTGCARRPAEGVWPLRRPDLGFHQYAAGLSDATSVPAEKLRFEITENGAIANMQKTIGVIQALSARGCRFSLDDFGSGMTSFSYLKQLPADFGKIDDSFIQMMSSSEVDSETVRFTNDISHMMGHKPSPNTSLARPSLPAWKPLASTSPRVTGSANRVY